MITAVFWGLLEGHHQRPEAPGCLLFVLGGFWRLQGFLKPEIVDCPKGSLTFEARQTPICIITQRWTLPFSIQHMSICATQSCIFNNAMVGH